jgi:cytochrome c5
MTARAGLSLALLIGATGACSPAPDAAGAAVASTAPGAPTAPIALVHQHQCGRCHRLPAPGLHPRSYLEQALAPHHKRVHLTDDEWTQLIDYLAARPDGS